MASLLHFARVGGGERCCRSGATFLEMSKLTEGERKEISNAYNHAPSARHKAIKVDG